MFRVEWVVLFIRCFIELMFVCSENFVLIMLLRIMIELSKCLVSFFYVVFWVWCLFGFVLVVDGV